jgi:putative addiction module component (TIGR02574 family)
MIVLYDELSDVSLSNIEKIKDDLLHLPYNERAFLAEKLLDSLDEEEDPEAEKFWIEEVERRYKEYKEGKVKLIPAEAVFDEVRSQLE